MQKTVELDWYSKSPEVLYELLRLINDGKMVFCADVVYTLYCAAETSDEDRHDALVTLATIARPDQRQAIAADLISGKLHGNELIAAALRAVGLQALTVEELVTILCRAQPEPDIGGGPVVRTMKYDLIPTADLQTLQKLLTAILRVLPGVNDKELPYRVTTGRPREFWMLSVLPDCFRRGVALMMGDGTDAPQSFVEGALWMENLEHSEYVYNEDYQSLRAEIGKHPGFRRRVARAIAHSDDVGSVVNRLTWQGLVGCSQEDLDWLLREARWEDIDPAERQVWYRVARNIAFSLRGKSRRQALAVLSADVDGPARADDIKNYRRTRIENRRANRNWRREERARKAERWRQLEESKAQLLQEIAGIRNGSQLGTMQWLVSHAARRSNASSYTKVNLEHIERNFGHEIAEAFSEGLTKVWRQIPVPSPIDYPGNRIPWDGLIGLASVNHAFAMGLSAQNLSVEDIIRVVQLCIWESERPEPWLDELVALRADTVVVALMLWFEYELGLPADNSRYLRTVDFILRAPHVLQRPFLRQAVELMRDGKVCDERLQLRLFRACTEAQVPAKESVAEFARRYLMSSTNAGKPVFASEWVAVWAEVDFVAAWSWLETNATVVAKDTAELAGLVAEGLKGTPWVKGLSGSEAEATALVSLFRFLSVHADTSPAEPVEYEGPSRTPPIQAVRDSIPRILANLPGKAAHVALQGLVVENTGTPRGDWLQGLILEHASAAAERRSVVSAAELPHLGEVYCRDPHTAGELFEHVVARLQEIRDGLEGGPFSDRVLFAPGMDEKKLQLWLAARLSDTPLRRFIPRFNVHREPQVDADKRTDIEVSSAVGKVCIEIKPVDSCRSYSAISLTKTLREQLVGQYLRGQNSKHGVLVVFRLEDKKWKIPGGPTRGNFNELIEYLRAQTTKIREDNAEVEDLRVIGIDCVPAKSPLSDIEQP